MPFLRGPAGVGGGPCWNEWWAPVPALGVSACCPISARYLHRLSAPVPTGYEPCPAGLTPKLKTGAVFLFSLSTACFPLSSFSNSVLQLSSSSPFHSPTA
ncbi:hypothetical protein VTO73DRAFT_5977 [Trametes versicolor]